MVSEGSATWRVTQPPGAARERTCRHVGLARPVEVAGCSRCLTSGGSWVNLLACLQCGAVGCCDSSPGRHAYEHFAGTGHPLARTLKAGRTWGWCYVDEVFLEQG
ncbi:UBP-type zinc finger domain-containing protein [Streptacidiphilus melanogenes]|uniref:UBP-type zinc finger domain-containing protein n=1 Tax=Streptacidiphilus melanogenes TaxID=411235 RepID=UPI0009FD14E4|nr:UBP-type zinc finger domain-containing protein [Streptacidiphilus melanogenes]